GGGAGGISLAPRRLAHLDDPGPVRLAGADLRRRRRHLPRRPRRGGVPAPPPAPRGSALGVTALPARGAVYSRPLRSADGCSTAVVQTFIRGLHNLRPDARGVVATIGTFDGIHLGHQAIMAQVRRRAEDYGLPSMAMIFEPHTMEFFYQE